MSEHVARTKHETTAAEKKAIECWQRSPNRWEVECHPIFSTPNAVFPSACIKRLK